MRATGAGLREGSRVKAGAGVRAAVHRTREQERAAAGRVRCSDSRFAVRTSTFTRVQGCPFRAFCPLHSAFGDSPMAVQVTKRLLAEGIIPPVAADDATH